MSVWNRVYPTVFITPELIFLLAPWLQEPCQRRCVIAGSLGALGCGPASLGCLTGGPGAAVLGASAALEWCSCLKIIIRKPLWFSLSPPLPVWRALEMRQLALCYLMTASDLSNKKDGCVCLPLLSRDKRELLLLLSLVMLSSGLPWLRRVVWVVTAAPHGKGGRGLIAT